MPKQPSKKENADDSSLGFEVLKEFERFDQINDIFSRAFWDESVKTEDTEAFFQSYRESPESRGVDGFTQRDFALRNASWAVSDIISERSSDRGIREGFQAPIEPEVPIAPKKLPIQDVSLESKTIKSIARVFGADLVGIAKIDERWHYASRVDTRDFSKAPNDLPDSMKYVIVMGHAMRHDLVETYPSALAGASPGMEYSHEASIAIQLASYIRHLGFDAIASMNDTALVIPYAIQAGLGEYGRNQMVLTPEFGPRVRFSKVFTSLPLVADKPQSMGLKEYCDNCTICADSCPPQALPFGSPEVKTDSLSTIRGIRKWSANCEKCFSFWAKLRSDCAICMRVCPFNRTYDRFIDKFWRWLATSRARWIARAWIRSRPRQRASEWWASLNANQGRGTNVF